MWKVGKYGGWARSEVEKEIFRTIRKGTKKSTSSQT